MEINNLINKIKNQPLKHFYQEQQNLESPIDTIISNKENFSQSENKMNIIKKVLTDSLLSQFYQLDKSVQQNVLNTWLTMNIPFKKEHLQKLIRYLNMISEFKAEENNSTSNATPVSVNQKNNTADIFSGIDPKSLIKASAYLIKNKLPLIPELITGLASNLEQDHSLSEKLKLFLQNSTANEITDSFNNYSLSTEKENEENFTASRIKNLLSLNLSRDSQETVLQLTNYSDSLNKVIQFLYQNQSDNLKKIFNHLTGQKLINLQNNNPGNNLLLSLEIPILMAENSNPLPLYLQIKKENQEKEKIPQKKNKNNYRIKFIIELDKLGTITADIEIKNRNINCKFITEKDNTLKIIKDNFSALEERLNNTGFQVKRTRFKNTNQNNLKQLKKKIFEENIKPDNTKKFEKEPEEYVHIDFTI
ncbi:MAG: flagellar hook-length control protein FliK [Bacillota bacterium]